jgi:hypothetical protein
LTNGYLFRSSEGGIRGVRIKTGRIVIAGGGAAFGYTLDEPLQRRISVRLTIGEAADWCAEATASAAGSVDRPGLFRARHVGPPAECQAPPAA